MYPTSALVLLRSGKPPVGLTVAEAVVCALPVIPDPARPVGKMLGPVV